MLRYGRGQFIGAGASACSDAESATAVEISMKTPPMRSAILCLALGVFGFSGCGTRGLYKMIDQETESMSRDAQTNRSLERQERSMTWEEARKQMLLQNIELKRAEGQLRELKKNRKNQWREWLPKPSLYVSFQRQLREMSELDAGDISKSIYAPLAIPNPVTQKAKAYQFALQELQAEAGLEMSRRRLVVELYRAYSEWQRIEFRYKDPLKAGMVEDQIKGLIRAKEMEVMEWDERNRFQLRIARILNLPGMWIVPDVGSLPVVDYSQKIDKFMPGENYGMMSFRTSSYEIVGALLRSKGMNIQQYPPPRLSAGVPAIYDSGRGDGEWINDTDQINLFGSWSKSFDVTGRVAASIESAEDQVAYIRQSQKLKRDADRHDWERMKTRYRMLVEKRELLDARLSMALSRSQGDAKQDWEDVQSLVRSLLETERAKQWLDMEIWLWDDDAWK